jgi:hypothetical protein
LNPEKINQWLSLIANFGVIAGLIFLGLEIQQNTIAVRASAIQESTDVARNQVLTLATNTELLEATMKDLDEMSEIDRQRVYWSSRSFWIGMQGLYRQWKLGVLPEPEWQMWHQVICNNYRSVKIWPQLLIPEFLALVESCGGRPTTKE